MTNQTLLATIHELKVWPEYFVAIWDGQKAFDLRKDDRGFQVRDRLRLREYVVKEDQYTGREIMAGVSFILSNFPGLMPGYVVLGLNYYTMRKVIHPMDGIPPSAAASQES